MLLVGSRRKSLGKHTNRLCYAGFLDIPHADYFVLVSHSHNHHADKKHVSDQHPGPFIGLVSLFQTVPLSQITTFDFERPNQSHDSPVIQESHPIHDLGRIISVSFLGRSNLMALVMSGQRRTNSILVLWDDMVKSVVFKLEFSTEIKSVRLKGNKIFVVFAQKIHVYETDWKSINKVLELNTQCDEYPIWNLNSHESSCILAYAATTLGQVSIMNLTQGSSRDTNPEKQSKDHIPYSGLVVAHSSRVALISLSCSGHVLATTSEKGTIIRIWDTQKHQLLQELRRGSDYAVIYDMSFNDDSTRLCLASEKGTVHIFGIHSVPHHPQAAKYSHNHDRDPITHEKKLLQTPSDTAMSPMSAGVPNKDSTVSSFLPTNYFHSDWSFAQYTIPVECRCLVRFVKSSDSINALDGCTSEDIAIITSTGDYYLVEVTPPSVTTKSGSHKGSCKLKSFYKFYRDETPLFNPPFQQTSYSSL